MTFSQTVVLFSLNLVMKVKNKITALPHISPTKYLVEVLWNIDCVYINFAQLKLERTCFQITLISFTAVCEITQRCMNTQKL